MNLRRWCLVLLLGATAAFGSRPSFQEHAAVQESLAPRLYFVRAAQAQAQAQAGQKPQAIRKVVLVE
ncbi:hypothetical protein JXD38_08940 [candidate division WOR-3 bacterium]|nr:hypothetical protein [candidate division WOR-3 bacterium]